MGINLTPSDEGELMGWGMIPGLPLGEAGSRRTADGGLKRVFSVGHSTSEPVQRGCLSPHSNKK